MSYLENPTEPLIGFRFWYPVQKITPRSVYELVRRGDNPKRIALKSIGASHIWNIGENKSRCEWVMCTNLAGKHNAPTEKSRCGFYSYDRLKTVDEYIVYLAENTPVQRIIGATLNWGETILGTFRTTHAEVPLKTGPRGLMYRAQYSKIIAIMNTGPLAQKAADYYGVHCVPERYFEMACKEFGKKLNSQEAVTWLEN